MKHRVLHYKPEVAAKIVQACVVLHNMCINANVPEHILEADENQFDYGIYEPDEHDINEVRNIPGLEAGQQLRNRIVNIHFG